MADLRKQISEPRRGSAAVPVEPASKSRRARPDRGAETRQRLLEAALDVFGRFGFEGATTRQIAQQAGTNLAAINYHFGSKEALHIAVAEHIATRIVGLVGPALMAVDSAETLATPEAARAGLVRMIGAFADAILGEEEAEQWARFIVREQMQPTQAFDVIYRFTGTAHDLGTRLVAAATGESPESETAKLRTFAIMGQVLVFRVAQALVLRRIGWTTIGEAERDKIKRVIIAHIDAILDAERGAA
jgi:AcrR family transcriptional regulator